MTTAIASPRPAGEPTQTLDVVRNQVRSLLTRSAAFRALSPARQRQVAHDTVKVARFIADAGGDTADLPMTAVINNPAARQAGLARTTADSPPQPDPLLINRGVQEDFEGVQGTYSNPATGGAGEVLTDVIAAVDFPNFVGGLIEGVFNAIVQTSIQQMEAYAAMVANVAKSVDQYMQDNVSEAQAQDQLISSQPDLFQADMSGADPQVVPREDANPDQLGGFLESLGLPFDLDVSEPETVQEQVVPAMRKSMAMDRQKLLATMVLMGINRIVVTDGKIQASVVFDINARDVARRAREIETSFEHQHNQRTGKTKRDGWWIFSTGKETERTRLNVTTSIDTTQTDESESSTQLKTKLTGNVDLRFKSDYFPLERMLDMLGTSETVIQQVAQQPTPAQET
ncbi:MAG: hypothetical protein ACR2RE_00900, partial [Geminicoccaceae bacterium]